MDRPSWQRKLGVVMILCKKGNIAQEEGLIKVLLQLQKEDFHGSDRSREWEKETI